MNLGFSERWPKQMVPNFLGEKTYFIEKIWQGLFDSHLVEKIDYTEYDLAYKTKFGVAWDWRQDWDMKSNPPLPKLHTIRAGERWKAGDKIHFVVNSRTKNRFQFAPVLQCVSVQEIEIWIDHYQIFIDGNRLPMSGKLPLMQNDGFESSHEFFAWFSCDFKGQIIHWTDMRY